MFNLKCGSGVSTFEIFFVLLDRLYNKMRKNSKNLGFDSRYISGGDLPTVFNLMSRQDFVVAVQHDLFEKVVQTEKPAVVVTVITSESPLCLDRFGDAVVLTAE